MGWLRTMLIRDVMTTPGVTVTDLTPINTALRLMDQEQVTSVPVLDHRGAALVGIVSEADLAQHETVLGQVLASAVRGSSTTLPRRVGEVVAQRVVAVGPDDEIEAAVDMMLSTKLQNLPVLDKARVVGTVSRSDLIDLLADSRIRAEHCHDFDAEDLSRQAQGAVVTSTGHAAQRELGEVSAGTARGADEAVDRPRSPRAW
jgi:CBS domain-containing protein